MRSICSNAILVALATVYAALPVRRKVERNPRPRIRWWWSAG